MVCLFFQRRFEIQSGMSRLAEIKLCESFLEVWDDFWAFPLNCSNGRYSGLFRLSNFISTREFYADDVWVFITFDDKYN